MYFKSLSPRKPIKAPIATPPTTSVKNSPPTLEMVTFSTPSILIFRSVKKTTTPIPSLKSYSPAILVSVIDGRFIFFTIANTAIGSVGAIKAPKRRQST